MLKGVESLQLVSALSSGAQDVADNVTQSSTVSLEISKDIAQVKIAAQENAIASAQVHISAEQLSNLSERLQEMISEVKLSDN